MKLPCRIDPSGPRTGVIAVDGAWGAEGLNLSHWPGNTTPPDLVHELSTGSALAFARLDPDERVRRAGGASAIVNNHYDTDGVLAAFAVRHPNLALEREGALLAGASAGDFYRAPDERALALDALVTRAVDPEFSPEARALADGPSEVRYTATLDRLLEELPGILDATELPHRDWWEPVVTRDRADRAELAAAQREEAAGLDLCTWRASGPWSSGGPGRHALLGSTERDRVLAVAPLDGGHGYRLVVSTLSWFVPVRERRLPRPDLEALAARLNELEPDAVDANRAWRAQSPGGASPELWYGGAELESFAEHNDVLAPSALAPAVVAREVASALAATARR